MDPRMKKFFNIQLVLFFLQVFAPLTIRVIVERTQGPGSDARAQDLFPFLPCVNICIGMGSLFNLMSAMKFFADKKD